MFGGGKFDPWEAPAVSTWRQDIVSLPQTLMISFMALAAAHIQIQTKSVSLVSLIIFPSIHTIIFITTLWNCNILIYEIQHFVWPIRQFSFGLSVKQIQMNFEVILFALILVARQIACFNRARYHEKMYLDKVENSWWMEKYLLQNIADTMASTQEERGLTLKLTTTYLINP